MRIGIIGSGGRMGKAIASLLDHGEYTLAGGIDQGEQPGPLADRSDVLIDFSSPGALAATLDAARRATVPLVIGTTGLSDADHAAIDDAARTIPLLQTGNTSLGVTLLAHLVRDAAARLGPDWDVEIVEMHHRGKVDAPSGTALLLGEAAARGRGVDLSVVRDSGRDGHTGPREAGDIGFAALRGGTVAGDHSVVFAGEEERITLSHSAEARTIFARGAVRAARWLIDQPAGRYTMEQVLGL